ncbi:MAG: hypothetical protein JKX92_05880 [Porticoccaceae bacterium]|nr:hypothetical protein [Porticoccaceae bacterium]
MLTLTTNNTVTARRSSIDGLKTVASKSFAALNLQQREGCVYRIYDGNGIAQHELIAVATQQPNGGLSWRRPSARERGQGHDDLPTAPAKLVAGGIDVNRAFNQVFG